MQSALPALPGWWPWADQSYVLTRFLLKRGIAALYLVAFLVAVRQFRPLAGEDGLTPIGRYLDRVSLRDRPSIFHRWPTDRAIGVAAWSGVALSSLALLGIPGRFGLLAHAVVWLALWVLYQSFVNAGQVWYGYGWESMLLEAGFLAIFLGAPGHATPEPVIWLFRWLLVRNMLGAGLIKLRADDCWRELTCLDYHYETQPMPNPLSWYVHHAPAWFHRVGVAVNHVVEVFVPLFYVAPQPVAAVAGAITIGFQGWLILTGNFSWLNWLTVVIAVSTFSDATLAWIPGLETVAGAAGVPVGTFGSTGVGPWAIGQSGAASVGGALAPVPLTLWIAVGGLTMVVLVLSYWPARNLVSSRQAMNASFDPFHLVNTYGAFGSITRTRHEVVIEGTDADDPDPDDWREYEVPGKPGDPSERPPQLAPYHSRLGWQLWFAAMGTARRNPWVGELCRQLLDGDGDVRTLFSHDPFPDEPPQRVRASLYRYRFTTPEERRETGDWWHRERLRTYYGPASTGDRSSRGGAGGVLDD